MTNDTKACSNCQRWAPMLRQEFLGICGVTKQCTDRIDHCERYEPQEAENVVRGDKMEGFLE